MTKFSVRLKNYREKLKEKDKKWTQQYVADKIGVARVTYTAYENGSKMPPFDTVNSIADLFDVKTDFLTGRSDDPQMTEDEDFEAFRNSPDLQRWYKELPKSKEEDLRRLKRIWEAFKEDE